MATRNLKAQVELSGEAKYKEALKGLAADNKVLSSEMRKLQSEFRGQTDSIEYLTRHGKLLEDGLEIQKDRVQKLREQLAWATEKYGEASNKTKGFAAQLNNAEAKLLDQEYAIKQNNEAIENYGKSTVALGDIAEKFADKLGIKIPEGAKNALNGVKGFSSGTVAAMGVAVAAAGATTLAYKKLFDLAIEQAAEADTILTDSLITGISTESLQKWNYAANLVDVSGDVITKSLSRLTRSMDDARGGNAELTAAFAKLGISITDSNGQLRDNEEVFYELVDALGAVENATERDALSMTIMGKSAQELNPLIIQGGEALRALGEEAENTGYILDEAQIKKLGEVDDAYQRMQLTVEANRKQLAVEFAPAAIEAMTMFSDAVTKAGKFLVDSGIITGLGSILESTLGIIGAGADVMATITGIDGKFSIFGATLGGVAQLLALVADTLDVISGLMTLDFGKVKTALGWNRGSGERSHWQTVVDQQEGRISYNATGNDNFQGGMTYINEAGPEAIYLPRGTQIATAQETRELGGDTFNFYIDAKNVHEFVQLVEMAKSARIRSRMKGEK